MANTTLNVTVFGGKPPVTIRVRSFKNNDHLLDISSPESFSYTFLNLESGNYDIYITGFNPKGGSTICSLTEDEIILNPPDPSPTKNDGVAYLVGFHFSVA